MDFKRTRLEFDEVERLVAASILKAGSDAVPEEIDEEMLKRTPEDDIIEDLFDILVLAYDRGVRDANDMLGTSIMSDISRMNDALEYMIGGKTFKDRAREHIRDENPDRLIALAESEYHRVYNTGSFDTASAAGGGKGIQKKWLTMLDDRVRSTHDFLEGVTVPLGEKFNTFDGDSALYPGGFENAENNVNCRCLLLYTFK